MKFIEFLESVGYQCSEESVPYEHIYIHNYYSPSDGLRIKTSDISSYLNGNIVLEDRDFFIIMNQYQNWISGKDYNPMIKKIIKRKFRQTLAGRNNNMRKNRMKVLNFVKF